MAAIIRAAEDTGGDVGQGPPNGGGNGRGGRPLPDDSGGGDDPGEGDS